MTDTAALHTQRAYELGAAAWGACVQAKRLDLADKVSAALEELKRAQRAAPMETLPPAPNPAPIPFHLLDTPDVRALAAGLRELLPLAERIDAARGRALPEAVGGSAGLDLAEDLAQMVARLELEAYGPAASVTGGRE